MFIVEKERRGVGDNVGGKEKRTFQIGRFFVFNAFQLLSAVESFSCFAVILQDTFDTFD